MRVGEIRRDVGKKENVKSERENPGNKDGSKGKNTPQKRNDKRWKLVEGQKQDEIGK